MGGDHRRRLDKRVESVGRTGENRESVGVEYGGERGRQNRLGGAKTVFSAVKTVVLSGAKTVLTGAKTVLADAKSVLAAAKTV